MDEYSISRAVRNAVPFTPELKETFVSPIEVEVSNRSIFQHGRHHHNQKYQ